MSRGELGGRGAVELWRSSKTQESKNINEEEKRSEGHTTLMLVAPWFW